MVTTPEKQTSIKGECPACASTEFIVEERIIHSGYVYDGDGKLEVTSAETDGITMIACGKCGNEVNQEHFTDIQFS